MSSIVKIYTDGAAKGNPGRGGYGVVMKFGAKTLELSEGFRMTTNNRMELMAVIVALEALKSTQHPIEIYSDSKYVVDSVEKKWVFGWRQKGYAGKKNKDLWERYIPLHMKFNPRFHWVKGHAGHPENERCDELAVFAAESNKLGVDDFYERSIDGDQANFLPLS
jgi:ribonuclease HI|tara:strand:- start:31336 stop:31830 length:495 start_codon:yes stop_codon:yes gene_type:complete